MRLSLSWQVFLVLDLLARSLWQCHAMQNRAPGGVPNGGQQQPLPFQLVNTVNTVAASVNTLMNNLPRPTQVKAGEGQGPQTRPQTVQQITQLARMPQKPQLMRSSSTQPGPQPPPTVQELPKKDDSWNWIRKANRGEDRIDRQNAMKVTLKYIEAQRYVIPPIEFIFPGITAIDPPAGNMPHAEHALSVVCGKRNSVLDEVVYLARRRDVNIGNIVAVNAASAYSVGGGVESGGRHALEESMCMQSTLFPSLKQAEVKVKSMIKYRTVEVIPLRSMPLGYLGSVYDEKNQKKTRHIPLGGAVLSKDVTVFRGGTSYGYPLMDTPVFLAGIASIAMPNRNPGVTDSPVDAIIEGIDPFAQMKHSFISMLRAAEKVRAHVIVLGCVGCNVFGNEPKHVATALADALRTWHNVGMKVPEIRIVDANLFSELPQAWKRCDH